MTCTQIEGLLTRYVLGDLEAQAAGQVEAHLTACPTCRAAVEEVRPTVDLLRQTLAARGGEAPRLDTARRARIFASYGQRQSRVELLPILLKAAALVAILLAFSGLLLPAMSRSREKARLVSNRAQSSVPGSEVVDGPFERNSVDSPALPAAATPPAAAGAAQPATTLSAEEYQAPMLALKAPSRGRQRESKELQRFGGAAKLVTDHEAAASPAEAQASSDESVRPTGGNSYKRLLPADKKAEDKPSARRLDRSGPGAPEQAGGERRDSGVESASDLLAEPSSRLKEADQTVALGGGIGSGHVAGNKISGLFARRTEKAEKVRELPAPAKPQTPPPAVVAAPAARDAKTPQPKPAAKEAPMRQLAFNYRLNEAEANFEERSKSKAAVVKGLAPTSRTENKLDDADGFENVAGDSSVAKRSESDRKDSDGHGRGEWRLAWQAGQDVGGLVGMDALRASAEGAQKQEAEEDKSRLRAPVSAPSDGTEPAVETVYPPQVFNPVVESRQNAFSTFGIDVDTASFTLARRQLLQGRRPPEGAVRVEEFVNAFEYAYRPPERDTFAVYADRARSPFRPNLEVLRIGVRGKVIGRDRMKPSALTFVIDTSGSMNMPDRIDLIRRSLNLLLDQLGPRDTVSIVAFGSEARLVVDRATAAQKDAIRAAIAGLQCYGSTHLEGGVRLAYEVAARNFASGALNRVLLLSDGVANLGAATAQEILAQVERYRKQGIYCSVFGFGQGNYNDTMLETLADKGDGVYRFIDSAAEARRAFVDDLSATLNTIARDVKIQVEFVPDRVPRYRQIGYENRHLEKEQFRDDAVDAGEVGSGQSVTALYEIEVAGASAEPLGTVRLRWMDADTGRVEERAFPIRAGERYATFESAPVRFRLAAGTAEFADLLRRNPYSGGTTIRDVGAVLRPVGLELSIDPQVQDLVRMVTAVRE